MSVPLPYAFTGRMKTLLGAEYEAFLDSYDRPRHFGLRVNTMKISTQEFEKLAPFHLKKIPWIENGYFYEEQDAPGRHPLYYAGLYYLQEPSAMTPASVLPVRPGERVLDLCAAPGGKATELGAKLRGEGLLTANDISASRARALLKNIEVFGITNAYVTNTAPAKLAQQFPEFFDKILVDAPCSGEGMFRKEPAAVRAWNAEKPADCAKAQKEIIARSADMLRPGGRLLYSTCTFAPEENEQIIAYLLESRSDMELLEIPAYDGFAPGQADAKAAGIPAPRFDLKKCVRIYPHRMSGEGHFLALLGRKEEAGTPGRTAADADGRGRETGAGRGAQKAERRILAEFLEDVSLPLAEKRLEIRRGQAYYVPDFQAPAGIPFLRNGLYLGEVKKDRFEPSQSLAMALRADQYARTISLDYRDDRVFRYLKGETIDAGGLASQNAKGWHLVCVNGYPLGWGKLANGALKNKYHNGWRMK